MRAFAQAAAGRTVAGDDSHAAVLTSNGRVVPLGPLDCARLLATPVGAHGRRLVLVVGTKNTTCAPPASSA